MESRKSTKKDAVELAKLRSENAWLRKQIMAYQDLNNQMLREFRAIERGLVAREEARMLTAGKRVTNG